MPSQEVTEITVPNFLAKLWKIVDEQEYDSSVQWEKTGFSFDIVDPKTLSRDILPLFFKHNNLSSFVRQLNMYGFRKMTPVDRSGLVQAKSDQEYLQFQHPYFVKGHPDMMQYIKRKVNSSGVSEARVTSSTSAGVSQILEEVKGLREKQHMMDSKIMQMRKENQTLWGEVSHMRSLHMKQQQIVSRLIQFLLSVMPTQKGQTKGLPNPHQRLAIAPLGGAHAQTQQTSATMCMSDVKDTARRYKLVPIDDDDEVEKTSTPSPASSTSNGRKRKADGVIIADVTDDPLENPESTASPLMDGDVNLATTNQNLDHNLDELDSLLAATLTPNTQLLNNDNRDQVVSPSQYMNEVLAGPSTANSAPMLQRGWSVTNEIPLLGVNFRQDLGDYLNNVDLDLDYLKDLLGDHDLSNSAMSQMMTQQATQNTNPTSHEGHIVGNELALYQAPNYDLTQSSAWTTDDLDTPVPTPTN